MATKKSDFPKKNKVLWLSRDSVGTDRDSVYLWSKKPRIVSGEMILDDHDEDDFPHDCQEFRKFCSHLGIEPIQYGELVKLTVSSQIVEKICSAEEVVTKLRAAKKFDKNLMKEAANWIEQSTKANEDEDNEDEDEDWDD